MSEFRDPFQPSTPRPLDLGRLVTTKRLEAGWPCRLCSKLLTATVGGGLICLHCDTVIGGIAP